MCGIAGICYPEPNLKKPVNAIKAMTEKLRHRGPDASGIFEDEVVQLGHRRLSIIEISEASNQPMHDYSDRFTIVFNGEIYNYRDIAKSLPHYPFRTKSDTEVILAAYSTWGTDCFRHFNGMFAFAIWDSQLQSLCIARDRIGEKPFYYVQDPGFFMFASEVRSILASGLWHAKLNSEQLSTYLAYQAVIGGDTMLEGVKRLEASQFGIYTKGSLTLQYYWQMHQIMPIDVPRKEALRSIQELMLRSISLRMVADVPVGAFLSGGIDSSLMVACMSELSSDPVQTFTICSEEQAYDESSFADIIAKKFKTKHHPIVLQPKYFLDQVEDIMLSMDTPSGDGPNTYFVSKYTREAGIKVAISGLGGDELFAGYTKFRIYLRLLRNQWMLTLPKGIRNRSAALLMRYGAARFQKMSHLLTLQSWDLKSVYPALRNSNLYKDQTGLLVNPNHYDPVESKLLSMEAYTRKLGFISQCTIGELESYTRDVLLRDTDQMSMVHGLEVRVPFFDPDLFSYVISLSDKIKFPNTPKQLLVEAMAPRIPIAVTNRKKMGFTLPFNVWLRKDLKEMAARRLEYLADRNEFQSDAVVKTWNRFLKDDPRVQWTSIWKLTVLSDWMQRNNV